MFLTVLARAESSDTTMYGSRVLVVALAWSVPVLIVVAGLDATFGLFAIWGHEEAAKPTAFLLLLLTWLVALLAIVAVKIRATSTARRAGGAISAGDGELLGFRPSAGPRAGIILGVLAPAAAGRARAASPSESAVVRERVGSPAGRPELIRASVGRVE